MTSLWTRKDAGCLLMRMVASTATIRSPRNHKLLTEPLPGNRVGDVYSRPLTIHQSLTSRTHPKFCPPPECLDHHPACWYRGSSPTTADRPSPDIMFTEAPQAGRKLSWRVCRATPPTNISTKRQTRRLTISTVSPRSIPLATPPSRADSAAKSTFLL